MRHDGVHLLMLDTQRTSARSIEIALEACGGERLTKTLYVGLPLNLPPIKAESALLNIKCFIKVGFSSGLLLSHVISESNRSLSCCLFICLNVTFVQCGQSML